MVSEMTTDVKAKTITNNNNNINTNSALISKDHLAVIKSNFLSPTVEVTFCDISDSDKSSIASRTKKYKDADADSIASSINGLPKKKYEIPDGGWGWMVVLSSLCISMVVDGVSFSFGLLYVEFLKYFKESESKTSWIGSLFLAIPLLSGPIMSNLVDNYGCRRMTIIGGLIAGTGFVLAAFVDSVEMMYLTFGVIAGLGIGICYVTAVVCVALWFDKRRTLATGIGASGTGIGTFVYAPLTQFLISKFEWRVTILVLAVTMYCICIFGALMRDPDWLIEENKLESRSQSIQTFSNSSVCLDEIKKLLDSGARKEDVLDTLVTTYNTEANQQISAEETHEKKYQSELHLPTYTYDDEFGRPHGSRLSLRDKKNGDISHDIFPNTKLPKTEEDGEKRNIASVETLSPSEKASSYYPTQAQTPERSPTTSENDLQRRFSLDESALHSHLDDNSSINLNFKNKGMSLDAIDENHIISNSTHGVIVPYGQSGSDSKKPPRVRQRRARNFDDPLLKRNLSVKNSHYFQNMRIHRNSIHYRGAMLNTHRYRLKASSCPNIYRNSMTTIALEDDEKWYDNFIDVIKSIFDFSLFLDIKFFFFSLSTLLLFTWFIVPYFYLSSFMIAQCPVTNHTLTNNTLMNNNTLTNNTGCLYTEDDSAALISAIGIAQTIGMVVLGWLGDQSFVNVPKIYGFCLFLCGISVALIPILSFSYMALLGLCILFGMTFASSFSYTPVILVSIVDIDNFTIAYGLVLLTQGVGNLIGPPLASFIFVLTQQWNESFYAAGFFILISGILVYITGILQSRDRNNEKNKENDAELSSTS